MADQAGDELHGENGWHPPLIAPRLGAVNFPVDPHVLLQDGAGVMAHQGVIQAPNPGAQLGNQALGAPIQAPADQMPAWAAQLQADVKDMRLIAQQSMMDMKAIAAKQSVKEPEIEWRHKGNKLQFRANKEVMEELDSALLSAKQADGDATVQKINKCLGMLKKRQKDIRLADMSDDGWRVVERYNALPIADDEADDRRIRKAQKEAAKDKAKSQGKSKGKKKKDEYSPYKRGRQESSYRYVGSSRSQNQYQQSVPIPIVYGNRFQRQPPQGCFTCGSTSHVARNCSGNLQQGKQQCEFCNNHLFHSLDCKDVSVTSTCICHGSCKFSSECIIAGCTQVNFMPKPMLDINDLDLSESENHSHVTECNTSSKKQSESDLDNANNVQGKLFFDSENVRDVPILHGRKYLTADYEPLNITDDYAEYEAGKAEISVVGRLKMSLEFLRKHHANEYVIDVIERGYIIPLKRYPAPVVFRNNASARNNMDFVRVAVCKLIDTKAATETAVRPYIVNPLTVVFRDDKGRLVLDCRYLNQFLQKFSAKFEGADVLMQYLKKGFYMLEMDLKSGYHHILLHVLCRKLLGFSVTDEWGNQRYFTFNVLPFGLSSAGYVFTKVLRAWIKVWRSQGILCVFFLDDGSIVASSMWRAYKHGQIVKKDLVDNGWVPNKDKSNWYPRQIVLWLGFVYNLIKGIITASSEKICKTRALLKVTVQQSTVPVRLLASVAGRVQSLHLAFGDLVFLKTRAMQMQIASCETWHDLVSLSDLSINEMEFWLYNMESLNGMSFLSNPCAGQIVYSDASKSGYAAFIAPAPCNQEIVVHREWECNEVQTSSMFRELTAVYEGLLKLASLCKGNVVDWFTDSMNVSIIIKRGSMSPDLQQLALRIFMICKKNAIKLRVIWIPRSENERADMFSRIIDYDDWEVRPEWFAFIVKRFGLPSIDRFASVDNRKVVRYNSRFFQPQAEATDAFTQDWGQDYNYIAPPIYLIPRVLEYLKLCKAVGLLVVPVWRSAAFWHVLLAEIEKPYSHIVDKLELGNIFEQGSQYKSVFSSKFWKSGAWVLLCDYSDNYKRWYFH